MKLTFHLHLSSRNNMCISKYQKNEKEKEWVSIISILGQNIKMNMDMILPISAPFSPLCI